MTSLFRQLACTALLIAAGCTSKTNVSEVGGSKTTTPDDTSKPKERVCAPLTANLRPGELPLGASGPDTYLCSLKSGEWVSYTINVGQAGLYDVTARIATPYAGNKLRIEFKGLPLVQQTLDSTSGWDNWSDVTIKNVKLDVGLQNMRVFSDGADPVNSFALDKITIKAAGQ